MRSVCNFILQGKAQHVAAMDVSVVEKVWDRLRHGIERIYDRPESFNKKLALHSISMYALPVVKLVREVGPDLHKILRQTYVLGFPKFILIKLLSSDYDRFLHVTLSS